MREEGNNNIKIGVEGTGGKEDVVRNEVLITMDIDKKENQDSINIDGKKEWLKVQKEKEH